MPNYDFIPDAALIPSDSNPFYCSWQGSQLGNSFKIVACDNPDVQFGSNGSGLTPYSVYNYQVYFDGNAKNIDIPGYFTVFKPIMVLDYSTGAINLAGFKFPVEDETPYPEL